MWSCSGRDAHTSFVVLSSSDHPLKHLNGLLKSKLWRRTGCGRFRRRRTKDIATVFWLFFFLFFFFFPLLLLLLYLLVVFIIVVFFFAGYKPHQKTPDLSINDVKTKEIVRWSFDDFHADDSAMSASMHDSVMAVKDGGVNQNVRRLITDNT